MLGLMGVGKTTIGRAVADALDWPLSDSDWAIEAREGATVRELRDQRGTEAMHLLEAGHLMEALGEERRSVICAAASVVDVPECREALEEATAYGVWLQGRAETLAERFATGSHRPVFGSDSEAVFRRQLGKRSRWFAEVSRHRVSVDGRTADEVVADILGALRAQGVAPPSGPAAG